MGRLATDKEARQGDNDIATTKSINEAAIALSQLHNSTSISDISNTQSTEVCTEHGHYNANGMCNQINQHYNQIDNLDLASDNSSPRGDPSHEDDSRSSLSNNRLIGADDDIPSTDGGCSGFQDRESEELEQTTEMDSKYN